MKKLITLLAILILALTALPTLAAPLRVFVADINVSGVQNRDELRVTLQTLLASRLSDDKIVVVGSAPEAEALVSGTYIVIGKTFSIDTVTKTAAGKIMGRAFVQGESQDELIAAIGKLAEKITAEFSRNVQAGGVASQAEPAGTLSVAGPTPGDGFVRPSVSEKNANVPGWMSKRLTGAANLMAVGNTLPDGGRELFLAEDRRLGYYRQGHEMVFVADVEMKTTDKIISLDTILGSDGKPDIYVTIVRSDELASQVWQVRNDKLVMVAEKLPYFFRSASLAGGPNKLYAQTMGRSDDFYGDVAEATRTGSDITLKNPIKMPRYGTLYNFNQLRDRDGVTLTTVINPDGYLIIYDLQAKELWRSNDKFGGSELYFQREDESNLRVSGDKFRWVFLNQRIQISSKGEIIVGKNDGFWILGNARSYKRGSVFCLQWNGSSLEERWHTRDSQNYMPDFYYDEHRKELLMLQTVQRPGFANRGASSLTIKTVE